MALTLTLAPPCFAFIAPVNFEQGLGQKDILHLEAVSTSEDALISNTLSEAASQRSVPSSKLLPLLEELESEPDRRAIPRNLVEGTFELIYSSAVANLPLIGSILDGYLPNKEIIVFDLENGKLSLTVETLPMIPSIDIEGEGLTYDEATSTLEYTVTGKSVSSQWAILYADETLLAAKSSVTGLNVIKRI